MFFLLLALGLIPSCFSFICNVPNLPLTKELAEEFKEGICRQLSQNTKFRLQGGGSIECSSPTAGTVLLNDGDSIPKALCFEMCDTNAQIDYYDQTTCPEGLITVPLSVATDKFRYICDDIIAWHPDSYSIFRIGSGASFKNWGHREEIDEDCEINPSEPGTLGVILCMDIPICVDDVDSGETSCPEHCDTCASSTCQNCQASYLLYDGACYSECPPETYESGSICEGNKLVHSF